MLQEDGRVEFIGAMLRELDDHNSIDHRKFMDIDQLPNNTKTIISI